MAEHYDLAIVGGGPAGQAAAIALDGLGLNIAIFDEQARPGGQILRGPPRTFTVGNWLPGRDYEWLKVQVRQFEQLKGVSWFGRHSVIEITRGADGFIVLADGVDGIRTISAQRVLLAGGCQDLAVPLHGWTLPGVYAAGGIQAYIKSQQIVPGQRFVMAGTHPLQVLIAAQIVRAGGTVTAVAFAQSRQAMFSVLLRSPLVAIRNMRSLLSAAGAMWVLHMAGVPTLFGTSIESIDGEDRVTGVTTAGGVHPIKCDTIGLNYGFVPQSVLPRMLGATMQSAGAAGGFAATHDAWMQSSVAGLYVAGETVGVAGAPAARTGGIIAGIGIARDLGLIDDAEAERRREPHAARHRRSLRFAALLDAVADPRQRLPICTPETVICRCEAVTHRTIVEHIDIGTANSIKLVTRCGMGPCQGRNCEPTLLRMLAGAGKPNDPGFTQRFPARPVSISDLADKH